jgi:diguanylate cyclase (GGDEF)-like protein/PAS domain S-box-containing protein
MPNPAARGFPPPGDGSGDSPLAPHHAETANGNERSDDADSPRRVYVAELENSTFVNALLESALDCVIAIDHQGRILEFNPAAERTFGYRRADVLGKELAELIVPPDLREGHRRALARWKHAGTASGEVGRLLGKRLELRAMRSDGSEFPVELAINRLNLDGPPLFTASLRDITERTHAEERLRAAEARYRTLVEQLPLITYVDSPDDTGPPMYVSPQVEATLGYSQEEWLSHKGIFEECLHPGDRQRVLAEKMRAYERDEPHHAEYRVIATDGREVWILDESVPAQEPDGTKYRQGFALDITARKLSDEARLEAEAKYRTLVEQLPLVTYIDALDAESSNIYSSPQIEPLLGYSPEEWRADRLLFVKLLHPKDRERVLAAHGRSRTSGEPLSLEYRLIARDGRTVWISDEARITKDHDGKPLFLQGCLLDITNRKQAEEQLRYQAFHDGLTDLPNRALFTDRLEHALLRRGADASCAVLFLDLDDFKTVNDSLGHVAGDEVLRAVGERLRSTLRLGDTVARLGGDEFAVLAEDMSDPTVAAQTAERLSHALATPFSIDHHELFISASIGIALGTDPAELLRQADVAMYRAKEHGKAQYAFYESALDEAMLDRLRLVTDLRRASINHEFTLHYQPTVELSTGRIVGVEALVRWRHPSRGLLQPASFIPLAEETGLIVPVGRWVLAEACRQAMLWKAELGPAQELTMSVNVSPRQLEHPGIVGAVAAALTESGLDPHSLMLEITENVLMQSGDAAIQKLHELRKLGVRLALDDFGTGYSSLWALENLPVETLKIDRSFVQGIDRGPRQRSLARGIIEIGLTLGLTVVGEGIETAAQADELSLLGCPVGQGYYFARPDESTAITDTLARDARIVRDAAAAVGE